NSRQRCGHSFLGARNSFPTCNGSPTSSGVRCENLLRNATSLAWATFPSVSVIIAPMFSLSGTSSISIGRGARRRNRISKMTSARSSGENTGRSQFITERREGEEYLRMVLAESGATRVVGEDLGTVPRYVRPSLQSLGIAGFKIPQWEFWDGRMTPGNEFERLSVTTYATHDHKPIRELWHEMFDEESPTREQAREDLLKIAQFAGIALQEGLEYERDVYPAIMSALFNSNSWIAIVMITDLLARKDRFNVPGTAATTNWTRRLPKTISQMRESRSVRRRMRMIRELLENSGRIRDSSS